MTKTIFTTQATAHGGRDGHIETPDRRLDVKLTRPGEQGDGTNPEQLFAAGYAACFQSAMSAAARRDRIELAESQVTAIVGLQRDELGYGIDVELHVTIPGMPREAAEDLVRKAHELCPYSRATRGNVDVRLSVNDA